MNKKLEKGNLADPNARQLWNEIVCSLEEYTDDGVVAKFFTPEELILQARTMAVALSSSLYTPELSLKEVLESDIYHTVFITAVWGIQAYIKEGLVLKNHTTYTVKTIDTKDLEEIRNESFQKLTKEIQVPAVIQALFEAYKETFSNKTAEIHFTLPDKTFHREKLFHILQVAFYWGYLFGQETIHYS